MSRALDIFTSTGAVPREETGTWLHGRQGQRQPAVRQVRALRGSRDSPCSALTLPGAATARASSPTRPPPARSMTWERHRFRVRHPCLEESPVYLIGYSLGGAIALATAARDQRVHGVVCWAPASDLTAVFTAIPGSETFRTARQGGAICRNDSKQFLLKSGFFHDLDRHDPACYIKSITPRPVLLIQGAADTKVLHGQTADRAPPPPLPSMKRSCSGRRSGGSRNGAGTSGIAATVARRLLEAA